NTCEFGPLVMSFTVAEIAALVGGQVIGDSSLVLTGFAPADRAHPGDLTFAENDAYFLRADQSAASAILVDGSFQSQGKVLIGVRNARIAFAKVLPHFFPEPTFAPGIHSSSVVSPSAQIDPSVHIGPHCVIGDKARIGPNCVLRGGNHVGAQCQLSGE